MRYLFALGVLTVVSGALLGDETSVMAWNGNGGRRDFVPIAAARHDLYALIDVRASAVDTVVEAAKEAKVLIDSRFEFLGETGGALLWNAQKFDLLEEVRPWRSRDRFAMKFQEISTGELFWVVLVDFDRRWDHSGEQAESLGRWIESQSSPVLVVGNFGFDIDVNQFLMRPASEPDHPVFTFLKTRGLNWVRPLRLEHLPAQVEELDCTAFVNETFGAWKPVLSIKTEPGAYPPMRIVFKTLDDSAASRQD